MYTAAELEQAQRIVYAVMPPTPQYAWPLLSSEAGCEVWVKHENQTPIGAFKVRGGIYLMQLRMDRGQTNGVITATRGNHGQSIPFGAGLVSIPVTVVAPVGNSREKNLAILGWGAELIEAGRDFDEAREAAMAIAKERGLDFIASFSRELVIGVSTYAHELFRAVGELDAVYVPVGMGSGICGTIAARDMLGLNTKVIGVVAEKANAYARSFAANSPVNTNACETFADGIAVRITNPEAFELIIKGAERIVEVSEDEIAEAMRTYYRCCHTLVEGAGAASLAALLKERRMKPGKRVGVVISGGNIDMPKYRQVLAGETPVP